MRARAAQHQRALADIETNRDESAAGEFQHLPLDPPERWEKKERVLELLKPTGQDSE